MAKRQPRQQQAKAGSGLVQRLTSGPALLAMAVVGAIAVVVVLILMGVLTQGDSDIDGPGGIPVQGRNRGYPDAPVTIVEYADYQCGHCAAFAQTKEPQIEEAYMVSGQVRLEFHYMTFGGTESVLAALAAECANDQDRFWDYHDTLFEEQGGGFSRDRLKGFAGELGLDQEAFDECLDSEKHMELIVEQYEAGKDAGVQATPWFFIDGQTVEGNEDYEVFERAIEDALAEAAESR